MNTPSPSHSSPDKCFDHLTYAPGLIAQAVATGRRRYDNCFGIVQWVSTMLRFNQHLFSLHQVEYVKAFFACITLEMIAELRAMDSEEHQGMLADEIFRPTLPLLENARRRYQVLPHPARPAAKVYIVPGSFDMNGAYFAREITPQIIVNLERVQVWCRANLQDNIVCSAVMHCSCRNEKEIVHTCWPGVHEFFRIEGNPCIARPFCRETKGIRIDSFF